MSKIFSFLLLILPFLLNLHQKLNTKIVMLKEKTLNALNNQVNAEQYSALLYLSMSAWFSREGLPGFANWMYVQFQEEMIHANKFFKYICERSGKAEVRVIA